MSIFCADRFDSKAIAYPLGQAADTARCHIVLQDRPNRSFSGLNRSAMEIFAQAGVPARAIYFRPRTAGHVRD
jgi:hypothetical protein